EAEPERASAAYAGIAFGAIYAVLIGAVYFIQLTTVRHGTAPEDILGVLSYETPGSLIFNLDLLGYGTLAISTFFAGLALRPRTRRDRALKVLLMLHGVFAPVSFALPILNVFGTMSAEDGADIGIMVLVGWCLYFLPIGVLAFLHFRAAGLGPARASPGDEGVPTSR